MKFFLWLLIIWIYLCKLDMDHVPSFRQQQHNYGYQAGNSDLDPNLITKMFTCPLCLGKSALCRWKCLIHGKLFLHLERSHAPLFGGRRRHQEVSEQDLISAKYKGIIEDNKCLICKTAFFSSNASNLRHTLHKHVHSKHKDLLDNETTEVDLI